MIFDKRHKKNVYLNSMKKEKISNHISGNSLLLLLLLLILDNMGPYKI